MPALSNPRHERFAQRFHKLGNARRAYREAGYRARKCLVEGQSSPLDACASRLLRNAKVEARLQELRAMAARRHETTVDTLLDDLESDRRLAHESRHAGAAVAATMAKARLLGLVIDRAERGQPGDFANLQSVQEVIDAVRRDLGDAVADALAAIAEREPSELAEPTHEAPSGRQ